jgi:cytoskeletal protein RodZ
VRERQGVSLEYLAEITRIRKSYLNAIETETFETLPAPVFIRGFLHQLARELHIPPEPMVSRYLERYSAWKQSRELSSANKSR